MRLTRLAAAVFGTVLASAPAAAQTPPPAGQLNVAVVVRVEGPPLLAANGQPSAEASARGIESSLRWLAGTTIPFALSPSPVWVDELLASGRTGTYAALLSVATRHPVLRAPYAHAILPLEDNAALVRRELTDGDQGIQQSLQTATQRILDPPALSLSDAVLDASLTAGLSAALAPVGTVGDRPVSYRGVTLVPVADSAAASPADVYGTSGSLAMVTYARADLPATLTRLAADKRIRLVNITDLAPQSVRQRTAFERPRPAPARYREAVERARGAVSGFASYTLPGNRTAHLLRVLLGRAESTADWQRDWEPAIDRCSGVVDLARAERSLVSASDGTVTLTSRRGAVPVTLDNRTAYPVRVRVRVTSPKLTFPSGDDRVVTISPRGVTIAFVAEARSTGSFPMDVSVSSPDTRVRFGGGRVVVRSTAANVLALLLTGSGLLFLIAWSSRDVLRRRLHRGRPA